jgi:hypothetical protein
MMIMVRFGKQHVALNVSPFCVETENAFQDADGNWQAYYNAADESAYFLAASAILSGRYGVAKINNRNTDIAFLGD